jgi:hypothetical protein
LALSWSRDQYLVSRLENEDKKEELKRIYTEKKKKQKKKTKKKKKKQKQGKRNKPHKTQGH